jgi:hypothetical protein
MLDSAFKVFELYAGSKSQLEIEFFNEVGTGTWGELETLYCVASWGPAWQSTVSLSRMGLLRSSSRACSLVTC